MARSIVDLLFGADERLYTALGRAEGARITLYDLEQKFDAESEIQIREAYGIPPVQIA